MAHPTALAGWISRDERMRGDVARYNRPRADEASFPEPNSTDDRCIGADRHAFLDLRDDGHPFRIAASREHVVRQGHVRAEKDVVGNPNMLPDRHAVLDGDVVPNRHMRFDETVIADIAVGADRNVLLDVGKCPNARAFADRVGFDKRQSVDEWWGDLVHVQMSRPEDGMTRTIQDETDSAT